MKLGLVTFYPGSSCCSELQSIAQLLLLGSECTQHLRSRHISLCLCSEPHGPLGPVKMLKKTPLLSVIHFFLKLLVGLSRMDSECQEIELENMHPLVPVAGDGEALVRQETVLSNQSHRWPGLRGRKCGGCLLGPHGVHEGQHGVHVQS